MGMGQEPSIGGWGTSQPMRVAAAGVGHRLTNQSLQHHGCGAIPSSELANQTAALRHPWSCFPKKLERCSQNPKVRNPKP